MKKLTTILLATAISTITPFALHAAEQVSSHDAHFIKKAAEGNLEEIQMAQLALQRSQDPQVRAYAQKLIDDHTKANNELKQIAQTKGVEFPTAPTHMEEHTAKHLEGKSGAAFDHAIVDDWVKDHQKDIKEYESESKHAKDPQVKQYAISTLPTLQDHLKGAQALAGKTTVHEPAGASHNYHGEKTTTP